MDDQAAYSKIADYLKGTYRVRGTRDQAKLLSHIEGYPDDAKFTVSPWELYQIALNTEAEIQQIDKYAKKNGFDIEQLPDGDRLISSSAGVVPEKNGGTRNAEEITVLDAFKWYLYHKVQNLSENGGKIVGIGDGVFAIKNELFLPDDFVPKVMMEMVEGSKLVDIPETQRSIQPSGQQAAIYIFGKHDNGKFLEPHAFYFNLHVSGPVPGNLGSLGEKILRSFEEYQKSEPYENFLFSRVMRNVIFNVETKHKREFAKPLFDRGKLLLLQKKGIADVHEDIGVLSDGLTVEKLKHIKREAEDKAGSVSDMWMQSKIKL